jgi:hypothetical protein
VRAARTRLLDLNSAAQPRAAMDPALRRKLLDEFTPDIERLGRLIERDLSSWLERDDAGAASATADGATNAA